ncbi:putative G-protein coupled receptor CG31760 [Glandiceps talaboti]
MFLLVVDTQENVDSQHNATLTTGGKSNETAFEDEVQAALEYVAEVERTRDNCTFGKALPLTYDDSRWEHEALVAVKAGNLLTGLLTTAEEHMKGGDAADDYLLYSVVRSNVEEYPTIVGSAIAFDKYYYRDYELFCPYAWRHSGVVNTKDLSIGYYYHDPAADWFDVPYVWYANASTAVIKSTDINSNESYSYDSDAEDAKSLTFPLIGLEHGYWTYPYFDCGGGDVWMITFSVPFFRLVESNTTSFVNHTQGVFDNPDSEPGFITESKQLSLEFAGVTTIDVDLDQVDINQCDAMDTADVGFDPFVNTHKCKTDTTKCIFIPGQGFKTGAYKCECRKGFYFPNTTSGHTGFNGSQVEDQYNKKLQGLPNNYDEYYDCLPCTPGCDECRDKSPCFVDQDTIVRLAIVVVNPVPMLLLFAFAAYTFKFRENKVIKAASPGLLYVILIGAFILYSGIIVEYFQPNDVTCMLLPWVRHLGFTLAYGALLFKTWRITIIFRVRSAKPVRIKDTQLYVKIGLVAAVFSLYLGVWSAVSRVVAEVRYNDDDLKYRVCTFDGWHYGGMGLELALLIWGVYLCIRVRKAPSQFNESKYISLAIYNETLLSLFSLVLKVVLQNTSWTDILYVVSFVRIQLTVTVMVILLFASKVHLIRKQKRNNTDDNKTGTGYTTAKHAAKKTPTVSYVDVSNAPETKPEPIDFKRDKREVKEELDRLYVQMEAYAGELKIVSSQTVTDDSFDLGTDIQEPVKKKTPKIKKSKSTETSLNTIDEQNWRLEAKTS